MLFRILFLTLVFFGSQALVEAQDDTNLKLQIGAILPLTGVAADYGEAVKNSIELAKSDFPELFNRVTFQYEDAAYDPKQAASAFHKLANIDKVDLIYVWGVAFCKVVAPMAETAKIPLVAQCIDNHIAPNRRYVVRFMNYTDQYLQATTEYLAHKKLNMLAVVLTENAYLEEMYSALERTLLPGQTVTVLQRYQSNEMDFRSIISRLRNGQYDGVGVFLSAGQIASFYKQLKEQRVATPTFGTNYFESLSEVDAAKGGMDGAVFANNEVRPSFVEHYREKFGEVTQIGFGALGYEFALTVGKITKELSSPPSGEGVLAALEGLPEQPGIAAGPYKFVNHPKVGRFFEFPIVNKEIEGKEFKTVQF